jgi:hypothetical protein
LLSFPFNIFRKIMKRKFIILLIAGALGAGAGALLGYGPMLRYKSEGVLNMDMGTSEYKRFTELANDASSASLFLTVSPTPKMLDIDKEKLVKTITSGEWHKPVPKVSKIDAKELPDIVLQMEREKTEKNERAKEKEKEKENDDSKSYKENTVYLGLRLTHLAADPIEAAEVTAWLGNYFKQVATREAIREKVSRWSSENRQFSDQAMVRKLKLEFEIQQAKNRSLAFKKIAAQYPESLSRESRQVINIKKDNEKFISPVGQLVVAEFEIIEIQEKIAKLNREIEQQAFLEAIVRDAEVAIKQVSSGSEGVNKLGVIISHFEKKVKTDAEREKLLLLAADLSQITARFLSQAQFIAQPSVPSRPERPTPLMYMVLMSIFCICLAAVYCWRDVIVKFLHHEDDIVNTSNA